MKSKEEINKLIQRFYMERISKKELEKILQAYLGTNNKLEDGTDETDKERDYTLFFTNAKDRYQTNNLIDIEFDYLKLRKKGWILITSCEMLNYVK